MIGAVDVGQLFELAWASALATVALAIVCALVIVGVTRAGEERRAGRDGVASAYLGLALVAGAGFAATVIFAITVIVSK